MSDIRDAIDAIETGVHHLEAAEKVAPAYSVGALVFARAELKVLVRRLRNLRTVLGDVDDPDPPAAA